MKTAEEWSRELFPAETPLTGPVSKENSAYRIIRQIQREAFIQGAMTARGALVEPVRLLRLMESYMVRWDSFEGLTLSVPERAWLADVRHWLAKYAGVE